MLPYGAPYLIGDAASARRDLTELRRQLAHAGVVAEAAVARPPAGRWRSPSGRWSAAPACWWRSATTASPTRWWPPWSGPTARATPRPCSAWSASAGRCGGFAAALGGLAATRSTPARLALERGAVDFRLAGLVVANGQFTMHRMKAAPRALPDDGRMSVIAFEGQPLTIYSRSKELYYGEHIPHPTIREYQSKLIEVDTAEPLTIALDGCRVPGTPPLTIDVLPEALRIKV